MNLTRDQLKFALTASEVKQMMGKKSSLHRSQVLSACCEGLVQALQRQTKRPKRAPSNGTIVLDLATNRSR